MNEFTNLLSPKKEENNLLTTMNDRQMNITSEQSIEDKPNLVQ